MISIASKQLSRSIAVAGQRVVGGEKLFEESGPHPLVSTVDGVSAADLRKAALAAQSSIAESRGGAKQGWRNKK